MPLTELSNVRAPGWSRVVQELTALAPDDRLYLARLVSALGQVSGARQAVLWLLAGQGDQATLEPRPALIWPFGPDVVDDQGRMSVTPEALFDPARAAKSAARASGASRQVEVYAIEGESQMYDGPGAKGAIIAVPVSSGQPHESASLPLTGVITLLTEPRSRPALQTTTALAEVLAGYVFQHWTQQTLRRVRASSASLDLAARLIASINGAADFRGCCLQLVNDLSRQLAVDRVALGWVQGANPLRTNTEGARSVRCIALSDTENVDRRMAMVQRLESAMDECLDQGQPVLYPLPQGLNDPVLTQAITHAHRELAASDAGLKVASFPLRVGDKSAGDKTVAVLLVETGGQGRVDPATIELVQATLDLVAPVLAVRHSDDRVIPLRVWDWMVRTAAWAVGPRHTVWKAAGIAAMAATAFLFLYSTTYRVGAPMALQARERRVVSMPYDGVIARLGEGAEAGRPVTQGQLLLELDTRDMLLASLEADNQLTQYDKQADEHLRKGELSEHVQARARAEQARARRDMLNGQIARSRITAPIAGTITAGDLRDKIGAAVKLGDRLFELADLSDLQVVARVDDRDIALISVGSTGEVSPKSAPALAVPFKVEQIVPLARAVDGQNVFEVRGRLTGPAPSALLDGMEGQARFNTQERSLAWIASRRIIDQLRIWLWW
jgi:hypothetical protein